MRSLVRRRREIVGQEEMSDRWSGGDARSLVRRRRQIVGQEEASDRWSGGGVRSLVRRRRQIVGQEEASGRWSGGGVRSLVRRRRQIVGGLPSEGDITLLPITSVVFSGACSDSTRKEHHLLCPLLRTLLATSLCQT